MGASELLLLIVLALSLRFPWALIPALDMLPDEAALSRQFRSVVTGEAVASVAVAVGTASLMGAAS